MALTDKLTAIADAVRYKTGTTDAMSLTQIAEAIASIETGGGDSEPVVYGTFIPDSDCRLTVNVKNTYVFKTNLGYAPKVFVILPHYVNATNGSLLGYIFYWRYITNRVFGYTTTGQLTDSSTCVGYGHFMNTTDDSIHDVFNGDIPIMSYADTGVDAFLKAGVTYYWVAIGKAEQ